MSNQEVIGWIVIVIILSAISRRIAVVASCATAGILVYFFVNMYISDGKDIINTTKVTPKELVITDLKLEDFKPDFALFTGKIKNLSPEHTIRYIDFELLLQDAQGKRKFLVELMPMLEPGQTHNLNDLVPVTQPVEKNFDYTITKIQVQP